MKKMKALAGRVPVSSRHLYYFLFLFCTSASVLAHSSNWQNPYVGGYLGGGSGNAHISTNAGSVTNTSYFTNPIDINVVNNAGTWQKEPNTVIVGLQAGHDWTWKQMVYGAVVDYGSLSLNSSNIRSNTYPESADQYLIDTSISTNWLFTLRGRVGYQGILTFPSFFYLTGGMAMTQLKVGNSFNDNTSLVGMGGNESFQNQIGWVVGAGIDVATFKHVSMNVEYLYIDIPSSKTVSFISNTQGGFGIPEQSMLSPLSTTANFYANIFKVGVNYRFDEERG